METGNTGNRTVFGAALHPCYEIDQFSYKLTTTPSAVCVVLYGFLTLLSVVTVCGNLLVIISVLYFKQLHTPTNFLILSLAVVDLLMGILVFPLSMAFPVSICLYYRSLLCKVRDNFATLCSTSSIIHLSCISVDRYYAVCQPLTYKTKISHDVVFMITVSWGAAVLIGVVMILSELRKEQCDKTCLTDVLTANTVASILTFYIPVVIMLCIYLKIFLVAQKQAQSIQTRMKCESTVSKMESKATKTLATVLGVFLCCWTPFFLCFTFMLYGNKVVPLPVIETLNWLVLTNSTLNPFIYAFYYSWFKTAFKMIISIKILHCNFANIQLQ